VTRSSQLLLGDILEAARLAQRYTAGVSMQDFARDIEKQDAVLRRIEIIGEAVKRLPEELRREHPDVRATSLVHGTSSSTSTSEWIST
jgi:uncharacterized protein with HEPN domain